MTTPTPASLRRAEEIVDANSCVIAVGDRTGVIRVIALSLDQAVREEREKWATSLAEQRKELDRLPLQAFTAVGIASTHKMLVKLLVDQVLKERERVVEECCKEVCLWCKKGWKYANDVHWEPEVSGDPQWKHCAARPLRYALSRQEKA